MPAIPQGTLDLLILQAISRKPMHGYAIARWIESSTDDLLAVQEGALYPALSRLQQKGWIAARRAVSEFKKDIKVYDLTSKGRTELERRTKSWMDLAKAMTKVFRTR